MANGFVYFDSAITPGAPRLSGTQGDLINVMDWIINLPPDPYKWIKEFSGTNLGVYRAQHGDRLYLQIDDNQATTGTVSVTTTRNALVRMYDTMSDATTGTFAVPSDAQITSIGSSFLTRIWCKSEALSTASRAYEGIITSRYLWLVTYADSAASTLGHMHFFGDVAAFEGGSSDYLTVLTAMRGSALTTNNNNWIRAQGDNFGAELFSNSDTAFVPSGESTRHRSWFRATATGGTRSVFCQPCHWGLIQRSKSTATLGRRFSLPIPIVDTLTTSVTSNSDASYPRAIYPNVRILTTSATTGDTFSIGDRNFKCISLRGSSTNAIALETSNTDPSYEGF